MSSVAFASKDKSLPYLNSLLRWKSNAEHFIHSYEIIKDDDIKQGTLTEGEGKLSTADLLVLTSLEQLLLMLKTVFTLFYQKSYPIEEVNRTEPSSVSVPCKKK